MNIQYDYTTEVVVEQGFLEVIAQVTITKEGDAYLDWWEVEEKMIHTIHCPNRLKELLFEIAEDHMKEDL